MKKGERIPIEHNVVRYISFSKLRKDENDVVVGILGTAFQLREQEKYLSTTYLEHFSAPKTQQVISAVHAIRASDLKVGGKAGFAIGMVSDIQGTCLSRNHKIRIISEPENDNKAHVAIRQFPTDDSELLELLSADAWSELVLNKDVESGEVAASDQQS
ncbi:MAG: hypothetical protein QM488_07380 [Rhizobiaceae bacterium]